MFGYTPPPEKKLESDADFRARILYVAGDGSAAIRRIEHAQGVELDQLAMEFELSRRLV